MHWGRWLMTDSTPDATDDFQSPVDKSFLFGGRRRSRDACPINRLDYSNPSAPSTPVGQWCEKSSLSVWKSTRNNVNSVVSYVYELWLQNRNIQFSIVPLCPFVFINIINIIIFITSSPRSKTVALSLTRSWHITIDSTNLTIGCTTVRTL